MPSRLLGIDLLRGLSAFGIVACHLMLYPAMSTGAWIQHFSDLNVAIFAAIAGFVMSARVWSRPVADYAKDRVRRLLPAYLLWSAIFVLTSAAFKVVGHESVGYLLQGSYWIDVLFKGGASCHLWFLACLFYAQVLLRLAGGGLRQSRCSSWTDVASVAVALGFILLSTVGEDWWFKYFSRLTGFLALGVALRGVFACERCPGMKWLFALTVAAVGLHVGLQGRLPQYVRDFIVVCPVTLFFASLRIEGEGCARLAAFLAETSLTVYLVHPILTKVAGLAVKRVAVAPYGVQLVLADWVACYVGALAFAAVVRMVKGRLRK